MAYVANVDKACMLCVVGKHPLYTRRKFKSESPKQCMNLVRHHYLCFNCLQPGHFISQCSSDHKRQKVSKQLHKLLHSLFERDKVAKIADQDAKHLLTAVDNSIFYTSQLPPDLPEFCQSAERAYDNVSNRDGDVK